MKVNRNSWHYKLLAFTTVMRNALIDFKTYSDLEYYKGSFVDVYENDFFKRPKNSCQYIRQAIITPFLIFLINSIVFGAFLYVISLFPLEVVGIFAAGMLIVTTAFLLLVIIAIISVGGQKTAEFLSKKSRDAESIAGTLYKNYKDNVCTLVEMVDEEKK